jgi:hypothetical protein
MTLYPNIIYHADSGTLIFIDTLQGISNPRNADIVEYTSAVDGKAKSFTKERGQRSLTLDGKISTENENTLRRQLDYLTGKQVYIMLGAEGLATLAKIRSFSFQKAVGTYTPLALDVVCEGSSEGQFWEAEDCNFNYRAVDTPSSDSTQGQKVVATGPWSGTVAQLTQNDMILPAGEYTMFARLRDSNQITDDVSLTVINATDNTYPGAGTTYTLSASYAIYTLDFTIDDEDAGDTIRFFVQKETTTTNDVDIDFFGYVRTD